MSIKIETPPGLKGTTEQQITQMYAFLFRLSENLNVALNNLSLESFSSASDLASTTHSALGAPEADTGPKTAETYNELRALINNTADLIHLEMDSMKDIYSSQYNAVSEEWGSFQEEINTTIEKTAHNVVSTYEYDASIQSLNEAAVGFSDYMLHTEGYIRQGFIDYDEDGAPIIGIAIGQNLKSTTVVIDGEEYQHLDRAQSCAFYTAEKVSFRVNGVEVAYVSNKKLYIHDVEITGSVIFNSKWMLNTIDGFEIRRLH